MDETTFGDDSSRPAYIGPDPPTQELPFPRPCRGPNLYNVPRGPIPRNPHFARSAPVRSTSRKCRLCRLRSKLTTAHEIHRMSTSSLFRTPNCVPFWRDCVSRSRPGARTLLTNPSCGSADSSASFDSPVNALLGLRHRGQGVSTISCIWVCPTFPGGGI